MPVLRRLTLLVCLAIATGIASSQAKTTTIKVVDYERRIVELPREACRIVSLVPSALRILVQVGAEDKIVAIDRKSAAAAKTMLPILANPSLADLPVVGDRKEPNLEAILAVKPDLIITSTTADKADILQKTLGIPVLCVVSEPDEDYDIIRMIGAVSGRSARAESVISFLSDKARMLESLVAKVPEASKKRVYLALFTNSGKFTQTMPVYQSLKLAGGINVASEVKATTSWGSVEVNKERILAWNPDVVFVDWMETDSYLSMERFISDPEYRLMGAVKNGEVHYSQTSHDGKDYVSALAEAYYMASILYPDYVTPALAAEVGEEAFTTVYGLHGYYSAWVEQYGIR